MRGTILHVAYSESAVAAADSACIPVRSAAFLLSGVYRICLAVVYVPIKRPTQEARDHFSTAQGDGMMESAAATASDEPGHYGDDCLPEYDHPAEETLPRSPRKRRDSDLGRCSSPKKMHVVIPAPGRPSMVNAWAAAVQHARNLLSEETQARIGTLNDGSRWYAQTRLDDTSESQTHLLSSLLVNGRCQWPDCKAYCSTAYDYFKHIHAEHFIGEKTVAQFRIQTNLVQQLGKMLEKEILCLSAMYAYLSSSLEKGEDRPKETTDSAERANHEPDDASEEAKTPSPPTSRSTWQEPQRLPQDDDAEMVRQAMEPYRSIDSRPPITYIVLIRQAILESTTRQLALCDIYQWFSSNFIFFKPNVPAWKNAVRHNLSLHKCFVRVENFKGAVWTVNEVEYQRRKSHRAQPALPYLGKEELPSRTSLPRVRRRRSLSTSVAVTGDLAAGTPFYAGPSYVLPRAAMLFPPPLSVPAPFNSPSIRYITSEEATEGDLLTKEIKREDEGDANVIDRQRLK
eukprot:m.22932 g.22932  ORF g.22932 m.22932 type:complete len:514 (+) comp28424_c1_seq2:198-1739(+)